jgi:hypothetical protein
MKPEQLQAPVKEVENTRELVLAVATNECRRRDGKETTDPFEAILEAYAKDPERWDGLE